MAESPQRVAGQSFERATSPLAPPERGDAHSAPSRPAGAVLPDPVYLIVEKPVWNRRTRELRWRGDLVLRLSRQASVERRILNGFQQQNWIWVIRDPVELEPIGPPTLARRHALVRLNRKQGKRPLIRFASLHGRKICWFPAAVR